MDAYERALSSDFPRVEIGAKRTIPGTVNAAIVSYYNTSADFRDLSESTKKMRRAILEQFRTAHGDKRIALLDQRALVAVLSKKKAFAAKNWLKTLRGLIRHCIATDLMASDPTVGLKLSTPKSTGFHSWSEDEIAQYKRRHAPGTRAARALTVLLCTGQARSDVVRMGRQHVREGVLSIRRQKTGVPIDIPVLPELRAELERMPAGEQLAFLTTEAGKPFTPAGFGNWFRDRCDEAGLSHCAAHGLRKAAATRLAEAGATELQLMAWFGWTSIREAERYTKAANRKRLAQSAAGLIAGTSSVKPEIQFANSRAK